MEAVRESIAGVATSEARAWYKDAIIYQLHVRAFHDSDGDGIGDFRGLTQKLDYIRDLGVTAVWLLPFYPSPLRDDGYDIADYTNIHPAYGTLRDFRQFLREARRQGLRVVTELVLNHTSDEHPWFVRARRAPPGSPDRDVYVWSDSPDRYADARIIFKDFEASNWAWDREAGAYYWHRFYAHQPDLNFDNPRVRRAMFDVVDFWLGMGVDGLRLDAVPYLYEREDTNCENLPETHAFLKELRRHVDERFEDRMLLAEANQWPEDAVAYFGDGDECHMAFHFPVMPRMFMAIRMEDRFPLIDILKQTPPIPSSAQWAMFLRNHDELTLEMVTDEERDYMYRVYAQDPQARINLGIRRRLAPLLGADRKTMELMNGLLCSLPGTPVVYYGDELGMGDNIYLGDRNGVRTPMHWSPDRNAGFSRANPQRLYLPVIIDPEYHYEAFNVEAQQTNPNSLLWWMRRLIGLRKHHASFGSGSLEFLYPENRKILAFIRSEGAERILVVANLSRLVQVAELDLSAFRGVVPVELSGGTEFPAVGDGTYVLTLGPHAFYWLSLDASRGEPAVQGARPRTLAAASWDELLGKVASTQLADAMPAFLRTKRWFGGKARRIKSVEIADAIPVPAGRHGARTPHAGYLILLRVWYADGDPEIYLLPLAIADGEEGVRLLDEPAAAVARLRAPNGGTRVLYDAMWSPEFCRSLIALIAGRRRIAGDEGKLVGSQTKSFRRLAAGIDELTPEVAGAEQSNTSVMIGNRLILKLYRRPDEGTNPDLEIGRFLSEQAGFPHVPATAGALEYHRGGSLTVCVVQEYIEHEADAWEFTLDAVGRYYERVLTRAEAVPPPPGTDPLAAAAADEAPPLARDLVAEYLESARLLGERTAELHIALCSAPDDPSFAPEPFTPLYQRSLYQSMRALTSGVFQVLRRRAHEVPQVRQVLDVEDELIDRFRVVVDHKITAMRTRVHGDYHLGQVLFTGKDFVITDFEGEPARPLGVRRIKRSPLTDVAGMLRSFHYAAFTPLLRPSGSSLAAEPGALYSWAGFWHLWASAAFLGAYLQTASGAAFLPREPDGIRLLLDVLLLEKAVYELGYEANNRPDWLTIPIHGLLHLMEGRV